MTTLDAVLAELRQLAEQMRALAADVAALRLKAEGTARRNALLCELAGLLGLGGATWASAQAIWAILAGVRAAPAGAEDVARALAGTRLSDRHILRILQADAEARATDKSRALCQWPASRNDARRDPDEDPDHAPE